MQTNVTTELAGINAPGGSNDALQKFVRGREHLLDSIPSIPAILPSLVRELELPAEKVDLLRVADLISRDKSLTAQCIRMANSALFSRSINTDSVRGAIRTLGISHIYDIVNACVIVGIGTSQRTLDPVIFWQHSLGCAILSRKLARSVGFENPEKAYLAGLLHDIGYIVNIVLAPGQMKSALEVGSREQIFLGQVERSTLGFTHCESGDLLARKWNFSEDIVEVVRCHHNSAAAIINPALVAIVALADRMCRSLDLGLGYRESLDPAQDWQADWEVLVQACPRANQMTWKDFVKDADTYFAEIRELVAVTFNVPTK